MEGEVTPELHKQFVKQYPIPGAAVLSADGRNFMMCHYDEQGNELKIMAEVGDVIRYKETPASERKNRTETQFNQEMYGRFIE
jgi:hypothetical protein